MKWRVKNGRWLDDKYMTLNDYFNGDRDRCREHFDMESESIGVFLFESVSIENLLWICV